MSDLFGLILAGGRSSRMGADKGLLDYRGKPHREFLHDVLAPYCARVFISIGAGQTETPGHGFIMDNPAYETSPLGALLTANEQYPNSSWFVVSCDLAYFDDACARLLVAARDINAAGAAFRIEELSQPEPLATIYEASFVRTLPETYRSGERSLRRALYRAGAAMLAEPGGLCVESVDTPEGYERARRELEGKRAAPRD